MYTANVSLHRRATIACALVCALVAPAAASAQGDRASAPTSSLAGTTSAPSQDLRSPDTRAGLATPTLDEATAVPAQDLRSADARDAAMPRVAPAAPDVTVVKVPQRGPIHSSQGTDWSDAGIAAGAMLGIILLGSAGMTAIVQRRRRAPRTVAAA
jgi:hypothetical protein